MTTTLCPTSTPLKRQAPELPHLFVVWIDCNCGTNWPDGEPDWEIDNPPGKEQEPLRQALAHAAYVRAKGLPAVLMLPGQTPRSDGLMSNPRTDP